MTNDQYLCQEDDVNPETGKEIFLEGPNGGYYLVLLRQPSGLYGYHNECPHQGRPMNWATDQFLITKAGEIMCPHHGALFTIQTGQCIDGPCMGSNLVPVELSVKPDGAVFWVKPADDSEE